MINEKIINFTMVSLGASFGANIRFYITKRFYFFKIHKVFKVLIVNLISSFILGFYLPLIKNYTLVGSNELFTLFLIGFIGSLSTFSTFIHDLFKLYSKGKFKFLILLTVFSISLSLIFLYFGFLISSN